MARVNADLRVRLGAVTLDNPVLLAAGTAGYGLELQPALPLKRLGAVVVKTLTRRPREGNPPPRLVETPAGMLNAVGLHNIGLESFLREKLPPLRALGVPIIVSILDESADGLAEMAAQLDRTNGITAIELNLSCPNLKGQGTRDKAQGETSLHRAPGALRPSMVAQDADATATFVAAARAATRKPIWAKLSPDVTDMQPIAQAAERAGADALVIGNTFTGMSIDPHTRRSRIGSLTGGVSGPAIHPLALYRLWMARQAVQVPLIGVGGVVHTEDAVDFLLVGASAVEVGTATFADPAAALKVLDGLARYLARQQCASVQELIGTFQGATV